MNGNPRHGAERDTDKTLPVGSDSAPVPTFGCVVYLRDEAGQVHGRIANLAGIEVVAADQRTVLGQLVGRFKQTVSQAMEEGRTPDWIEPPDEKREGERKVFLPVHL